MSMQLGSLADPEALPVAKMKLLDGVPPNKALKGFKSWNFYGAWGSEGPPPQWGSELPLPGSDRSPITSALEPEARVSTTEALGESHGNCGVEWGDVICLNVSVCIYYAFGQRLPAQAVIQNNWQIF